MLVKVDFHGTSVEVDFEQDDGLDVLAMQVQSALGFDAELTLTDAKGRVLETSAAFERAMGDNSIIYCFDKACASTCTRDRLEGEECIQQGFRIEGTDMLLCSFCATTKLDGSLLSPFKSLVAFSCQSTQASAVGLLYESQGTGATGKNNNSPQSLLYTKRCLYDLALEQQRTDGLPPGPSLRDFSRRLDSGKQTVLAYEAADQQAAAREAIDYKRVKEEADQYLKSEASDGANDVAFVIGLLRWFKNDFFRWCNRPKCEHFDCQAPAARMEHARMDSPTESEKQVGWASRVEVYRCKECARETRFARFNKPSYLLQTKRGRCGEWANAFGLICRALALDTRYILDFTDHVWVEVYVPSLKRYVHCDPCEKTFDAPLCYEKGWNKALTHVIAFSRYGISDASPRYSRKLGEVVLRRGAGMEPGASREVDSSDAMKREDQEMEKVFSSVQEHGYLRGADADTASPSPFSRLRGTFDSSTLHLLCDPARLAQGAPSYAALSVLELRVTDVLQRKADDSWEIEGLRFAGVDSAQKQEELKGRGSGDREWREQRGEVESGEAEATAPALTPPLPPPTQSAAAASLQELIAGAPFENVSYPSDMIATTDVNEFALVEEMHALVEANPQGTHTVTRLLDSSWRCPGTGSVLGATVSVLGTVQGTSNDEDSTVRGVSSRLRYRPSVKAQQGDSPPTAAQFSSREGMWRCKCPLAIVCSQIGEDLAHFVDRVKKLAQEPACVGFLVNGSVGESLTAVTFGSSSLPQAQENSSGFTSTRYLKRLSGEISGPPQDAERLLYVPLSGKKHGDTASFDLPACVPSFAPLHGLPSTMHGLRISEIWVWASHNFVNGLQITYQGTDQTQCSSFRSPLVLGTGNPKPTKQVLKLEEGEEVVKISVRAGALVDSLFILTSNGAELKAGGGGGGPPVVLDIRKNGMAGANGTRFVGFFGGYGGHLHNIGAVLLDGSLPVPSQLRISGATSSFPAFQTFLDLCRDNEQLTKWASHDGIAATYCALRSLYASSSPEECTIVLDTLVSYASNIMNDPANEVKRSVKASNGYFSKKLLVVGKAAGLALFCNGPADFSVEAGDGGFFFRSSIRLFHEGGSLGRSAVVEVMQNYIAFLHAAKRTLV